MSQQAIRDALNALKNGNRTWDAMAILKAALGTTPQPAAHCPYIRSGDEGTSYCALAEKQAAQDKTLRDAATQALSTMRHVARVLSDLPSTNQRGTKTRIAWDNINRDADALSAALSNKD